MWYVLHVALVSLCRNVLDDDSLANTNSIIIVQFMDFAKDFCQKIRREGYWADYIDPCSGLPMLTRGCNKVCRIILWWHAPVILPCSYHSMISIRLGVFGSGWNGMFVELQELQCRLL